MVQQEQLDKQEQQVSLGKLEQLDLLELMEVQAQPVQQEKLVK